MGWDDYCLDWSWAALDIGWPRVWLAMRLAGHCLDWPWTGLATVWQWGVLSIVGLDHWLD
jgi:hypothetical protein